MKTARRFRPPFRFPGTIVSPVVSHPRHNNFTRCFAFRTQQFHPLFRVPDTTISPVDSRPGTGGFTPHSSLRQHPAALRSGGAFHAPPRIRFDRPVFRHPAFHSGLSFRPFIPAFHSALSPHPFTPAAQPLPNVPPVRRPPGFPAGNASPPCRCRPDTPPPPSPAAVFRQPPYFAARPDTPIPTACHRRASQPHRTPCRPPRHSTSRQFEPTTFSVPLLPTASLHQPLPPASSTATNHYDPPRTAKPIAPLIKIGNQLFRTNLLKF